MSRSVESPAPNLCGRHDGRADPEVLADRYQQAKVQRRQHLVAMRHGGRPQPPGIFEMRARRQRAPQQRGVGIHPGSTPARYPHLIDVLAQ